MRGKIDELTKIWQEKVELRNQYVYGEEDISFEEFAELFKDTFEIIKCVKNKYIFECVLPECASEDTLDFLKLLTTVAKYTTYDNAVDESKDKEFTVTALIAEELVHYATGCETFVFEGDKHYLCDSDETNQGLLTFYRDSYPFYKEEDWEHEDEVFKYNVYEANFDEITELAKQLM